MQPASLTTSSVPPECLNSDGTPYSAPLPSWDSPPLEPSDCSLALGSYAPETLAELAALRGLVSLGLGSVALLLGVVTVTTWRRG